MQLMQWLPGKAACTELSSDWWYLRVMSGPPPSLDPISPTVPCTSTFTPSTPQSATTHTQCVNDLSRLSCHTHTQPRSSAMRQNLAQNTATRLLMSRLCSSHLAVCACTDCTVHGKKSLLLRAKGISCALAAGARWKWSGLCRMQVQ